MQYAMSYEYIPSFSKLFVGLPSGIQKINQGRKESLKILFLLKYSQPNEYNLK